jgi:hypothetical protein
VNRNVGWSDWVRFGEPWNDGWYRSENNAIEHGWDLGIDYVMREDGLYTLDGQPADEYKNNRFRRQNRDRLTEEDAEDVEQRKLRLQEELKKLEQRQRLDSLQKLRDSIRTGRLQLKQNLIPIHRSGMKPDAKKHTAFRMIENISPLII